MNDQRSPSNLHERRPVDALRRWLANQVVASHGMGMWMLFSAPLVLFVLALTEQHKIAAIIAGSAMVAGFGGTICFAYFSPHFLAVSHREPGQRTVLSHFLRRFRSLVGNGDIIQGIARRIDPGWQNSHSGRTPEETASWLLTMEVIHWAALVASIAPIAAGFWYNYRVFSYVYVAVNLVYNVFPILVIRETRRRVNRISQTSLRRHN